MNRYLLVMILAGIAVLSSCSPAEAPSGSARTSPADLISALSTGDHRVLDAFHPTDDAIEALRRQRPDAPYILGRALERRGRDAAAQRVYQSELTAGSTRWAGFSAVRLAVLSTRRDAHTAAYGHAQTAVDVLPEFRDGWMALGTAVYRRDDYSALREVVERIPPERELSAAERVSSQDLSAEVALWRAVSAWETGEDREAAFRDAFIMEPLHAIHERLFLFLFYRSDGLSSFAPELRLLMEAVYRQHRGESREAVRLMTMIEPGALIELTMAAWDGQRRRQPEPLVAEAGIWTTLSAMIEAHSDSAATDWVER
ncbi:MAG TPA: hypothetical protein VJ932_06105, partial [Alkalispirochaeta sp.]|nr:hypothetical protein [Alkalispirochaeta sp.]